MPQEVWRGPNGHQGSCIMLQITFAFKTKTRFEMGGVLTTPSRKWPFGQTTSTLQSGVAIFAQQTAYKVR